MPRKSKDEIKKVNTKKAKKVEETLDTNKVASTITNLSKKVVENVKKATKTAKKEATSKTSTAKNSTAKKSTARKTASKKTTTTKKKTNTKSKKIETTDTVEKAKPLTKVAGLNTSEYYDLPQKYNKTVIKLLAQTPKTLFVYWEISDDDIKKFKKQYGDNFFETTKPVLIVHNDTLNYSFEVDINDFANSWYLHVNDSKSDYRIELGRRPINNNEPQPPVQNNEQNEVTKEKTEQKIEPKPNYIYVTSSNEIESPNDHILFNDDEKMIYFRNVKTNVENAVPITSLSFIKNMGKIYEIQDLYHKLYKNEEYLKKLSNPSSHSSSKFK